MSVPSTSRSITDAPSVSGNWSMPSSGEAMKETCILLSPSSAGSTKSCSPSSTTKVPDVAVRSFELLSSVITALFSSDISICISDVSALPHPAMSIANAVKAAAKIIFVFFIILSLLLYEFFIAFQASCIFTWDAAFLHPCYFIRRRQRIATEKIWGRAACVPRIYLHPAHVAAILML